MQKNFKQDFEDKYNEIFKNLYLQWKLQSKRKCEELKEKGIFNSGVGTKEIYKLMEELTNKTILELKELFIFLPEKYNRKINLKDLEKYEQKTRNNIIGHIENMEKEIEKIYKGDKLFPTETNRIFLNNLKDNSILKVQKICEEIIKLRKGKKIEGLVIFDIVFTLLGFIVGVASFIIGVISICK